MWGDVQQLLQHTHNTERHTQRERVLDQVSFSVLLFICHRILNVHVTPVTLGFLICKMGITQEPLHRVTAHLKDAVPKLSGIGVALTDDSSQDY